MLIISDFIIAIVSHPLHKALPHLSASKHKQKNSFFIINNIHSVPVDTCGQPGLYSDRIIYSGEVKIFYKIYYVDRTELMI